MSEQPIRVRFAPSPTGSLHVGGARTALFNWLFARGKQGSFVLRVEDTDAERSTVDSERAVIDDLRWLGLEWDEGPDVGGDAGPYRQSERQELYHSAAEKLLSEGKAYYCYCTAEELQSRSRAAQKGGSSEKTANPCRDLSEEDRNRLRAEGRPQSVQFKTWGTPILVKDLIRGDVKFPGDAIDDFIIVRPNGLPIYNFANVVDDHGMNITHILRGEEHLPNTNRQILLYQALGYQVPQFGHISLIKNPDGSKMSKRTGEEAINVADFRNEGYVPEALINFLVLLGWSLDGKTEFFTVGQMIENFSLDRVNPSAAVFDRKKLKWMNGQYLRNMPLEERVKRVRQYLADHGKTPERPDLDTFFPKAVEAVGDRLETLADFELYVGFAFSDEFEVDVAAKSEVMEREDARANLKALRGLVATAKDLAPDKLEAQARDLATQMGVKPGQLFFPARVALTGKKVAPGIFAVVDLLGKEATLQRLDAAQKWFSDQRADAGSVHPSAS